MNKTTGLIELIIFGRRVNGELVYVRPFDFVWNFRKEESIVKDAFTNNIIIVDSKAIDVFNGYYEGSIIYRAGAQEEFRECFGKTALELYHSDALVDAISSAKERAAREGERYIFAIGDEAFTRKLIPFVNFIRIIELPPISGQFVQYPVETNVLDISEWTSIVRSWVPHSYIENATLKLERYTRDGVKDYREIEDHVTL